MPVSQTSRRRHDGVKDGSPANAYRRLQFVCGALATCLNSGEQYVDSGETGLLVLSHYVMSEE